MRRHPTLNHPLKSKFQLGNGRFLSYSSHNAIKLHYDWVDPQQNNGDDPHGHVVLFLHGLLGNGRNLRTMAKKVCQASQQPGLLLDIRGHGQSKVSIAEMAMASTTSFASCVQDIQHTLQTITQVTKDTTLTLVGHSPGGRLSLQFAHDSIFNPHYKYNKIHRVWLLDTVPGQANDSVERVVSAVTQISSQSDITNRKVLIQWLTSDPYNIDMGTAQWLASSLQPKNNNNNDALEFNFDLTVVHDLLADFHNQRFMDLLEQIVSSDNKDDGVRSGFGARRQKQGME